VLLPSATVFLLLLCNDRAVLGPWVNPGWLNALASVIVATLVLLSLILMTSTLFPGINTAAVALIGGAVLAVSLVAFALVTVLRRSAKPPEAAAVPAEQPEIPKERWTMPPLVLLDRPKWSTGRKVAMLGLRGYLVISVILLIVKATQLGGH
jgi:multisubunit Na+/H+ antiporter MnhB subunit